MTPRVQQQPGRPGQPGEQRKGPDADHAGWAAQQQADDGLAKAASGLSRLQIDFNISYVAPERRSGLTKRSAPREILKGITGRLRPGRLTAVLGPSGAGKTSFLSILAGQRTTGVEGRVLVNGRELPPSEYRQHCVLIAQELSLLGALTARETLQIAADLKLPNSKHSAAERAAVVESIAATLGLEACLDTAVTNMSGGERKRLSVGVELVTNPPIMLFDEPTSGLDSVSSVQVVSHLRTLALSGRTVVVVLHQPSSRLFQLFDDVLVMGTLARGAQPGNGPAPGRCLYCGPADQAAAAFSEAGFTCPTFYNIADYVVEVASGQHGYDAGALLSSADLAEPAPGEALELEPLLPNGEKTKDGLQDKKSVVLDVERARPQRWAAEPVSATSYPVSSWVQFKVLLRRSLLVSWRDMNMAWLRFMAHLFVAVILGFLYQNIGNEASKVSGNVACLFFFILFLFFSNAMPTVLTFPLEASVFYREYSNNWYSLPAYYLSKVLADLPFMLVNPSAFLLVAYYMTDQPTDEGRRCMVWFICLLTVLLAHAYGLVFGAAFGMQLGIFLVPASTIPLILFSGFFLYIPDIPLVLRWLSYVSSFRYGFEGLVASIYGMNRMPLKCSVAYCHWRRPTKFLEDIGMPDADYWTDITGLVSWIVVLHVLLLISFKVQVYLRRQ